MIAKIIVPSHPFRSCNDRRGVDRFPYSFMKIENAQTTEKRKRCHPSKPAQRSFVLFLLILGVVVGYGIFFFHRMKSLKLYELDDAVTFYSSLDMVNRYILTTQNALETQARYATALERMKQNCPHPATQIPSRSPHNVVVIMGESLRRQDMHCYGYPLENTPHLDSLIANGSLIVYDDVVTCGPNTYSSLKEVLTLRDRVQKKEWDETTSLPIAFSSAGYFTYWCSNQEPNGTWIEAISTVANSSDSLFYTLGTKSSTSFIWKSGMDPYDESLLSHLLDYHGLPQGYTNLFTLIHLYGNHSDFSDRYPESFDQFKGSDLKETHLTKEQAQKSAEYMNSILYNDWVVSKIIDFYSKTSSIVIYLSDHGLSRYDLPDNPDHCAHAAHPLSMQVPFMVYFSNSFAEENPDLVELIDKCKELPFMTDYFSNSLVSLMGIQSQYSNPPFELWSKDFNADRPRHFSGWGEDFTFERKQRTKL